MCEIRRATHFPAVCTAQSVAAENMKGIFATARRSQSRESQISSLDPAEADRLRAVEVHHVACDAQRQAVVKGRPQLRRRHVAHHLLRAAPAEGRGASAGDPETRAGRGPAKAQPRLTTSST